MKNLSRKRRILVSCLIVLFCLTVVFFVPAKTGGALVYGDLNGDGRVDIHDAILALQAAVGSVEQSPEMRNMGNVSRAQGTAAGSISLGDAILILRYTVGDIKAFPVTGGTLSVDPGIPIRDIDSNFMPLLNIHTIVLDVSKDVFSATVSTGSGRNAKVLQMHYDPPEDEENAQFDRFSIATTTLPSGSAVTITVFDIFGKKIESRQHTLP